MNKNTQKLEKNIDSQSANIKIIIQKSLKYDYLQAYDLINKKIIFGMSTQKIEGKTRRDQDIKLANEFAKKLKTNKISKIIFDRSGYKYHGRIKLIADTLRKDGIIF